MLRLVQAVRQKKHQPVILALWLLQLYMELMGVPYFGEVRMLLSVFTKLWPRL